MRHRDRLPQLEDRPFLTDGGIETVLIFHEGLDLPTAEALRARVEAALRDALGRYVRPDGVYAPSSSWTVTARA